jgi:aspartate/methionine/tyrosine aminotransferase
MSLTLPSIQRVGSRETEDHIPFARAHGVDVLVLGGGPVLPLPDHMRAAVIDALDGADLRPSRGLPELRAAITRNLSAELGVEVDADRELVVTHGAMQALNVLLRAILRCGGNVVIPTPNFFFDGSIRLAGGEPVHVASSEETGWAWDLDGIAKAVDSHTRAILFSNPTNPTGYLPTVEELDTVIELGRTHDALVISDESYDRLIYSEGTFNSILGRNRTDHIVLIRSLSKGYALANWRVGYIVADPSVIDACRVVFEWECLHCGYVAQRVAAAAIQGPQDWLDAAFRSYQPKRDLVFEAVADNPWLSCLRPMSTPFVFVDVSRLPAAGGSPVELMLAAGIPTVPGCYFGAGADYVRIPFGAGPETVVRLASALRAIGAGADGGAVR